MNFWIILFTIAAAQGFFFALVLLVKKENSLPNRLLAAFLLLLAATLGIWILWWSDAIKHVPGLIAINLGFPLLYGPLLLLFYQATFEKGTLSVRSLWHFLPFILVKLLMLPFYLRFFAFNEALISVAGKIIRHPLFIASFFVQMIVYGIIVSQQFKAYFQDNQELMKWHRWIVGAYIGIIVAYLLYRILPAFGLVAPEWKYLISLALMFFIYTVAWLGYIQPQIFQEKSFKNAIQPVKYQKSPLTPEVSQEIFTRMVELMQQEQLYTNSKLNLNLFSKRLDQPRHYVSQAINENTSGNFADFVNGYRIRAAAQLLTSTSKKEMNIIEIAYKVGFNNKKAFNLAFKKITQMTPTEYRVSRYKK